MRYPYSKPAVLLATATAIATAVAIVSLQPAKAQVSGSDRPIENISDRQLQELITDAIEPLSNTAAVEPDQAAIIADPRGGFAYFIHPSGKSAELNFRLDRRTPAVVVPAGGYALVRDIRDQVFLVQDSGKYRELFDE
ncbi:MAG: hypothetical protein AAGI68_02630 [Planctomycetota bacterium]